MTQMAHEYISLSILMTDFQEAKIPMRIAKKAER